MTAAVRGRRGGRGARRHTGVRSGVRLAAALVFLSALAVAACGRRPALGADVVVSIGGEEVRYGEFAAYLRENAAAGEPAAESAVQSRLFDRFVDERLLLRLAADGGRLAPDADRRRVVEVLMRGHAPEPWSEAQLRAYYEAHRAEYERSEEVHLRQILVQDRAVAKEALEALAAGEGFAEVAARLSEGPKAHLGGDQGRLAREDLPPAFADAIFDLAPGEVTEIVPAEYGFHVFQVVERFPAEVVPLTDVAGEIRRALDRRRTDEMVQGFIAEARERYNVAVFPSNFPFDYRGFYAEHDTSNDRG